MAVYVQSLSLPETYADEQATSDQRATQPSPINREFSPIVG